MSQNWKLKNKSLVKKALLSKIQNVDTIKIN